MTSADAWLPGGMHRGVTHQGRGARYDELQSAYRDRLHSDLVCLMALRRRFHRPAPGASVVEDLRRVAHSMAGAAAMFEAAAVAGAAAKLEETAAANCIAQTHFPDEALGAALDALIGVLDSMRI